MSKPKNQPAVLQVLEQYAEKNQGTLKKTLKKTNITATLPKLITHEMMTKAQMKARGKAGKSMDYIIAELCEFNGDKLTADQVAKYLPAADTQQLQAIIFGDQVSEYMDKMLGDEEGGDV